MSRRALVITWVLAGLVVVIAVTVWGIRLFSVDSRTIETRSPTSTAAPTSSTTGEETAEAGPTGAGAADETRSPVQTASGSITEPVDGSRVGTCARLGGDVALPEGKTALTAVRNLNHDDPVWYAEPLLRAPESGSDGPWEGPQYFGSGDASLGQNYEVSLVLIDSSALDRAIADRQDAAGLGELVDSGQHLAQVTYLRVAGDPLLECA